MKSRQSCLRCGGLGVLCPHCAGRLVKMPDGRMSCHDVGKCGRLWGPPWWFPRATAAAAPRRYPPYLCSDCDGKGIIVRAKGEAPPTKPSEVLRRAKELYESGEAHSVGRARETRSAGRAIINATPNNFQLQIEARDFFYLAGQMTDLERFDRAIALAEEEEAA